MQSMPVLECPCGRISVFPNYPSCWYRQRSCRLTSWNDVESIHENPEIGRKRVFADHLDRQHVGGPRSQARCREVGMLGSFRERIRVDVLHEGSVQEYASDPGLRPAGADPADPRPG